MNLITLQCSFIHIKACTEILLPGSTNNKTDMFPPIPFTSSIRKQYCLKKYGVTPRPNWVATQFWANRKILNPMRTFHISQLCKTPYLYCANELL